MQLLPCPSCTVYTHRIYNGNSGIGAHVRRDLGYLICLMHLFRSGALTNLNLKKILLSITHAQRFLSYHLISVSMHTSRESGTWLLY